jgi:lysozyme C
MIDAISLLNVLVAFGVPEQDATRLVCIAEAESNFNPKAINHYLNKNGTKDYGLFQINSVWLKDCKVTEEQLLDIRKNISCAVHVYNAQGIRAWSTYKKCK